MHIKVNLDDIHSQELLNLQENLKQALAENLASQGLDKTTPAPLDQAFEDIGFIGCIETDQPLSTSYKQHFDFSIN